MKIITKRIFNLKKKKLNWQEILFARVEVEEEEVSPVKFSFLGQVYRSFYVQGYYVPGILCTGILCTRDIIFKGYYTPEILCTRDIMN